MKYAIITSKNEFGQLVNEGEAVLLNCMDKNEFKSFWEVRLLSDMGTTHCRWVDNESIKNEGDI